MDHSRSHAWSLRTCCTCVGRPPLLQRDRSAVVIGICTRKHWRTQKRSATQPVSPIDFTSVIAMWLAGYRTEAKRMG